MAFEDFASINIQINIQDLYKKYKH